MDKQGSRYASLFVLFHSLHIVSLIDPFSQLPWYFLTVSIYIYNTIQTLDHNTLYEIFKKLDTDKDNRITFQEFKEALKEPLLALSFNIDLIAL